MLFNIVNKKIFFTLFFILSLFFSFSHQSLAQSEQPLNITGVGQFDIYPWMNQTNPGFCILASFQTGAQTSVTYRKAPFSENPVWAMSPNIFSGGAPSFAANIQTTAGYQPDTEYVVQFLEIGTDGSQYVITPSNLTDEVRTMCTPKTDGTLGSSCPHQVPVVTDCSPGGINQALQNFDQNSWIVF